jgi:hypothetical protein
LLAIEPGSASREGFDNISSLIAAKLNDLGGTVGFTEPGGDLYKMFDTPAKPVRMVRAQSVATGIHKILLIAHMATVYLRGMLAAKPFRINGDEEISSPASRSMLSKLGAEHDVTFSAQASLAAFDRTVSQAGTNRNVIPAKASASVDVRVLRVEDFDGIEPKVASSSTNKLIAHTKLSSILNAVDRRCKPVQRLYLWPVTRRKSI